MVIKHWIFLAILPSIAHLAFAENVIVKRESLSTKTPEGMVLIPGGPFEMGINKNDLEYLEEMGRKVPHMNSTNAYWWFASEIPRHKVMVDSFYMDTYEVTNKEFSHFVEETRYEAEGDWKKWATEDRMDHPVVNVTWNDAKAYAEWAGKRLPTEAEWEYAAKGGKGVKWFPWGDLTNQSLANFGKSENFFTGILKLLKVRKPETTPAGSYEPNGFGLYDMCGNVSEWGEDLWKPYPGGPQETWLYTKYGPYRKNEKPKEKRIIRGGSWLDNPVFVRINYRAGSVPKSSGFRGGFRCAKSIR